MTLLEICLPAYLLTVPEIAALVRNRIYGAVRPQGVRPLPEITMERSNTAGDSSTCGTTNLARADMAIDSWSDSQEEVGKIAAAVWTKGLRNFSGLMGDTTIRRVVKSNEFSTFDGEPGLFRVTQTYTIWYLED